MDHISETFMTTHELGDLLRDYLLLQVGGEVEVSLSELTKVSATYAGMRFRFNQDTEAICMTLKTRESEYPPPPMLKRG